MTTTENPFPTPDDSMAVVDSCVAVMSEHFDSVLVLATRRHPDGTSTFTRTGGNFYASYGVAREWLLKHDEDARIQQRKNDD